MKGKAVLFLNVPVPALDPKMMKLKQFHGQVLHLSYPADMKVKTGEPEWSAFFPRDGGALVIQVDPSDEAWFAFERVLKSPFYTQSPGKGATEEGILSTPGGITGYHRLSHHGETVSWGIQGEANNRRRIHIQIWAVVEKWGDGKIWADVVKSIQLM